MFPQALRTGRWFLLLALLAPGVPGRGAGETPLLRVEPGGHTAEVRRVLFTGDGSGLISLGKDKVARLWDLRSGRMTRAFRPQIGPGPEGQLFAGALSPDAKAPLLAVGEYADNANIFLFDVASGRLIRPLTGSKLLITGLAFSPDGAQLASTSADAFVRLWDPRTGKEMWRSPKLVRRAGSKRRGTATETDVYPYAVSFSPNGREIAVASDDGRVRVWGVPDGREIASTECDEEITCLGYGSDGILGYGTRSGAIRLWSRATGRDDLLYRQADAVDCIAFSPDGSRLLTGGGERSVDTVVRLWSVSERRRLREFKGHASTVLAAAFSPDGGLIATGDASGKILVADPKTEQEPQELRGSGTIPFSAAWSRDGKQLAWSTEDQRPVNHAFDLYTASPLPDAAPAARWLSAPQQERGGLRLRQEERYGPILVRDAGNKEVGRIEPQNGDQIKCFAFTPEGRVVVGSDLDLALWEIRDRKSRRVCRMTGHQGAVLAVAVSPDGRYLASASADQTLRIWNLGEAGGKPEIEALVSLFRGSDEEWVAWNDRTGYYAASPGGDDRIGWQVNRGSDKMAEFHRAFQFRERFYRPDVVARLLEAGSVGEALRRADAARPAAPPDATVATVAEAVGKTPRVEIVAVESATPQGNGYVAAASAVQVRARVTDAAGNPFPDLNGVTLDLRVNRPVMSRRLVEVPAADRPNERWLAASLLPGENTVSVVARSAAGESAPALARITYRPQQRGAAHRDLYVLAVGVSAYTADPDIPSLNFAAADALAVSAFYKERREHLFDAVTVDTLTDAGATRAHFLDALARMEAKIGAGGFEDDGGDLAILFVSSHGFSDKGRFYFAPTEARLKDLAGTGVEWSHILTRLQNLKCANVLLVLDHCYAGGVSRALSHVEEEQSRGFDPADEALRETRQRNILTFTASTSRQQSYEHSAWGGHGAFTAAFLQALRGDSDRVLTPEGVVMLNQVEDYVYDEVERMIRAIYPDGMEQRPSLYCPPDMDKRIPLAKVR